ncbi:hypothetical protein EDC04DRAFT_2537077, partial [Pisolithus marmoratus]
DFHPDEILSTNWMRLDCHLGVLSASGNHSQSNGEEMCLDHDVGWMRGCTVISIPFSCRAWNPGPQEYLIDNFFYCSLLSVISERLLDHTLSKNFRFKPYKLHWHPSHKESDIGVHGEL